MMCSIESGLVYCLVTTKTPEFYDFMNRRFSLIDNEEKQIIEKKEDDFVTVIDELNNLGEESNTDSKSLDEVGNKKDQRYLGKIKKLQ